MPGICKAKGRRSQKKKGYYERQYSRTERNKLTRKISRAKRHEKRKFEKDLRLLGPKNVS